MVVAGFLWVLCTAGMAQQVYKSSDEPRPMALREHEFGRKFDESTSGTINPAPMVPRPVIISREEWEAKESSGTMRSHYPSRLTLHHGGDVFAKEKDPKQHLRNLQQFGWESRGWPDIPYHYVIDLDGNIYEARDAMKVGDTNTTYDPSGHLLVCVVGNYEIQAPSDRQLDAICDLYAWLADYYNVNPETLRGHMEYAKTACPGMNLYAYQASGRIEGEIRNRIRKAYLGPDAAVRSK